MLPKEALEGSKQLVGDLILARVKRMIMVSLPRDLHLREPGNLAGRELMNKLEHRIKPYTLKLEFLLRNSHLYFDVRIYSAAAVNGTPRVGSLFLAVHPGLVAALEVVVVERQRAVISLNQPTARSVVVTRGQHQRRSIRKRERALNEALAETVFANQPCAVVIL